MVEPQEKTRHTDERTKPTRFRRHTLCWTFSLLEDQAPKRSPRYDRHDTIAMMRSPRYNRHDTIATIFSSNRRTAKNSVKSDPSVRETSSLSPKFFFSSDRRTHNSEVHPTVGVNPLYLDIQDRRYLLVIFRGNFL